MVEQRAVRSLAGLGHVPRRPISAEPSVAAFMIRSPLAGSQLYDWIALRRVSGGGVATKDGRWFYVGRRVPGYVADTLPALHQAGLLRVDAPSVSGIARVALTEAGIARYDALCQQRRCALHGADPVVSGRPGTPGPAVEHADLPVRSPGAYPHGLLRRSPLPGGDGERSGGG